MSAPEPELEHCKNRCISKKLAHFKFTELGKTSRGNYLHYLPLAPQSSMTLQSPGSHRGMMPSFEKSNGLKGSQAGEPETSCVSSVRLTFLAALRDGSRQCCRLINLVVHASSVALCLSTNPSRRQIRDTSRHSRPLLFLLKVNTAN